MSILNFDDEDELESDQFRNDRLEDSLKKYRDERSEPSSQEGLEEIVNYYFETEILAASVRHLVHLVKCAEIGSDVVTCPLSVISGLLKHPLTDSGLEKFIADSKKMS